jgi:hypothetical protein
MLLSPSLTAWQFISNTALPVTATKLSYEVSAADMALFSHKMSGATLLTLWHQYPWHHFRCGGWAARDSKWREETNEGC